MFKIGEFLKLACVSIRMWRKRKIKKINTAVNEINHSKNSINYNVTVKEIPSYNVISLRKVVPIY